MSMRYLGASFDLHTGGIDLIFPHHEDEIAQSEAATGQPFVRTWLHCAHLQMGGRKMAKRTGNIARPADIYASGVPARALRYALISAQYRASLDFTDESLAAAAAAVEARPAGCPRRVPRVAAGRPRSTSCGRRSSAACPRR
jgi:cysteinyl-tRNA synthetase